MSGHLPPEIATQILTKLPVKSVVRFRCVSKTWHSLISCPNFISDHTAQTLNRSTGDRVLVRRRNIRRHAGNCLSNFSFHDKSFVESHEHPDLPDLLRSPELEIVGSCDGLICFHERSMMFDGPFDTILIWNPTIRKLIELPPLRSSRSLSQIWGFGFDSESRDHKVVRIVGRQTHGSRDVVVAETDIFDLKKGVWRSSSSPFRLPRYFSQNSFYLHGNLHCARNAETTSKYILLSFNLSSEVLHEMEVATDGDYPAFLYPRLFLINGLLSMAVVAEKQQGDAHRGNCSVWSMKEYGVTESWTKLFNIELHYKMNWSKLVKLVQLNWLLFWENGEVLLVERAVNYKDGGDFLVLYNPESGKSIPLLSTNGKILDACLYKESLILL